jgi:ribulose-bisphosphate carboxylase large chain
VIRVTFELEPPGSAEALAVEMSLGLPDGPSSVRGRVVADDVVDGRCVIELPASNWGRNVPMLVSALVAGEGVETRAFTRCRLVGLELPDGLLPGPALGAGALLPGTGVGGVGVGVGVILKPSLGLTPAECASIASTVTRAGAVLVKDDELLGDPAWCPLEERVRAVAAAVHPSAVYCPNVTGPTAGLVERAQRVVELGATGVMVNAFAQGLDSVLALRDAQLGVPVFAHRVGSGPMARGDRFGVSGAVLVSLTRWCGADFVQVGAYGGKLFDSDGDVDAQLAAARSPSLAGHPLPSVAVLGGGIGPANAASQAARAGGSGVLLLLGSAAYLDPRGLGDAVRATVESLSISPPTASPSPS